MADSIKCADCDKPLDDLATLPSGARAPCPSCGSKRRTFSAAVEEGLVASDHSAVLARREGRPLAFGESRRLDGRAASADKNDGAFSYSILGSSPQGEEQTLYVCKLLVTRLNSLGSNWGQPWLVDGSVVDCEAGDKADQRHVLQVQVVRAITDQDLWKTLNIEGFTQQIGMRASILASQLEDTIKMKSKKIAPDARTGLTLALDATLLPAIAFDEVIVEFHRNHGARASSLGFEAIWLVGPLVDLVHKLDQYSSSNT